LPDRKQENAIEITETTYRIYQHYQECKAIGEFSADGLVRSHAAEIRQIEDMVAENKQRSLMLSLVTGKGNGR